jgi:hypothetical protein
MSSDPPDSLLLPFRLGYCIAAKSLAREGARVGYMYREQPEERGDSGWRFFRGDETEEEVDSAENIAIYDVDDIAKRDRAIISRLHAPHGTAWDRVEGKDVFEPAPPPESDDDDEPREPPPKGELPIFPIVSGPFDLPGDWRCNLPAYFFIRREDADLVLWRKGLTMRFNFMLAGKLKTSKEDALAKNKASRHKAALAIEEEITSDMIRFGYELPAKLDKQGSTTLIGNIYTDSQWVLSAYQCDGEAAIRLARAVRASLDRKGA